MSKRRGNRGGGGKRRHKGSSDRSSGRSGKRFGPRGGHRGGRRAPFSSNIPGLNLNQAIKETERALKDWVEAPDFKPPNPEDYDAALDLYMDPWQKEAVTHLVEGRSVIVDAPTTASKTRVVEAYFKAHMRDPGFRAAYTTPVKSLSNDKLREFREMFGRENVGIATGDVKENLCW